MNNVTINKDRLRTVVEANRETHQRLYVEAHEAFTRKAIANLESMLGRAKEGKVQLFVNLEEPKDHTEDYVRVLEMLDFEVEENVVLSSQEFAQYVQDRWGWAHEFATSYASNTGRAL